MSTRQWSALGAVFVLLGIAAVVLVHIGASQRLGQPGLRVMAEPTYMTGGQMVRTQSVSLPEVVFDYTSEPVEITALEVNWLPKDTLFGRRRYKAKDGFWTDISVVLMGTDRTSIHKPQFCLDGQGWRIEKTETVVIPMTRPHPYELRVMKLTAARTLVENGNPVKYRGLYVYWFVADGQLTPYHGERMWWMARDLIWTGVLQRWAYVSYFAICLPGQEDAVFSRVKDLIAVSVPEFQLTAGPPSSVGTTAAVFPISGTDIQN